jgi:heat shock protein HslJ
MHRVLQSFILSVMAWVLVACTSHQTDNQASPALQAASFNESPLATFNNTYWKVLKIRDMSLEDLRLNQDVYIQFRADSNKVRGFNGCNRVMGQYEVSKDQVMLSKMASSRRYCQDTSHIEQAYMDAISDAVRFKISGETMRLYNSQNKILFELEATYLR